MHHRRMISATLTLLIILSLLPFQLHTGAFRANATATESASTVSSLPSKLSGASYQDKRNEENASVNEQNGQPRVIEHKMLPSELAELKREIGVYDENQNRSQAIGGYGTGSRPPTEEEWTQFPEYAHVVDSISIVGTMTLPTMVDETAKQWFPPIGNQGAQLSCTAWSTCYYMKTFQEAKEHDWNLLGATWENGAPSASYQDRIMSPSFVYNLAYSDSGVSTWGTINLICSIGACSWETMPYNPSDYTSWPSEEAWREAPLYRGNTSGWDILWANNDSGIANLKNWIASDNLAVTSLDSTQIAYHDFLGIAHSLLTSNDALTLDNYNPTSVDHSITLVGYDDSFSYTEQGQLRYGAFKIANSWGVGGGWENVPDGCFWVSYEAMKQRIGSVQIYRDRLGYVPNLVASFRISHAKRAECNIWVAAGSQSKQFNQFIHGGNQPFCANDIFMDITEFEDAMPDAYNQQYTLTVYDGGSSTTGTVQKFAVEYSQSTGTPISTVNNGYVHVYVTLPYLKTNWRSENLVHSDNDFVDNKVSMAADSNGYMYVAYDDTDLASGHKFITVERSIDTGRTWSFYCAWSNSLYDYCNPSLAIDPHDNTIYVAYELQKSSSDHDIYCEIVTPTSMTERAIATGSGDDRFPSITSEYQYGSANWQYISYEYVCNYDDRDLMFTKSTDHGNTWSTTKLHGGFPDYNVHAQTSITNAEGNIYIAYKWGADYNSACEIRVDRSTDYGSSWTQFTDIDGLPNGCSFPSIAATHGGDCVLVAFQHAYSSSDADVSYSYSMDKGSNWSKGYSLFTSGGDNEKAPVLAVDGGGSEASYIGGSIHVACRVGSYVEYKSASCTSPYSWGCQAVISDSWVGKGLAITTQYKNITNEFNPSIVWTDERTNDIYYSTVGHVHNLNTGLKYDTIQQAINANETMSGQTLLCESRTYDETLSINKTLTVNGENSMDTIIRGKGTATERAAVKIAANNSILDGFTIENGAIFGLDIYYCDNATVQNCLAEANGIGIVVEFSSNSKVLRNSITSNEHGMEVQNSPNTVLKENSLKNNQYNFGVYGDELCEFTNDIDVSNTIDQKPIYYWVNEQNKNVPLDAGYVGLVNCTNITIKGLDLENNMQGLLLAHTVDSGIIGNNILQNRDGIDLVLSKNITIVGNNIANGGTGNWACISLDSSDNNTIRGNNVTNGYTGIYLLACRNNRIFENNITDNLYASFWMGNSSAENTFSHNNFLNNVNSLCDYSSSTNTWDEGYPIGGNYWSGYNGTDILRGPFQNETGSDGIGDTPYVMDTNNTDHFPLMHQWSSLPVHNMNTGASYSTIQSAINAGSSGDTIFVESGTYRESVVVNKTVSLFGENKTTMIQGQKPSQSQDAFDVVANDVCISDFSIANGFFGIYVNSSNNKIVNNDITNNWCGIWLDNSHNNTVSANNITANDYGGIECYDSSNNKISGNTVSCTANWIGIMLEWASNNVLRNNTMFSNYLNFGVSGENLAEFMNDVDPSNTVDGKPIYYWVTESNKTVPLDAGYIALVNCTSIRVQNMNLTKNAEAVLLAYTSNSTITENSLKENFWGLCLFSSSLNSIDQNIITSLNTEIKFQNSSNNSISRNTMNGVNWGISFYLSSNNTVSQNSVTGNNWGMYLFNSSDNLIYHNCFSNNTNQAFIYNNSSTNTWDDGYPLGGNFWSDYNYTDANNDGLGDVPYLIDTNNRDNYPLTNPYPSHDIAIISAGFSPENTVQGGLVQVNASVVNKGDSVENSDITLYANATPIETITVDIPIRSTITVTFAWNTTSFAPGNYTLSTYATPVSNETNTADNTFNIGTVQIEAVYDVAMTSVKPAQTVVFQGLGCEIELGVANEGSFTEIFNVTVYANSTDSTANTTVVYLFANVTLDSRNSTGLVFTWNTTDFVPGTYTISAYATPVPGETNVADNLFVGNTVQIIQSSGGGGGKVPYKC